MKKITILLSLFICNYSYGQITRTAVSTNTFAPYVYTTVGTDNKVKTSVDSLGAVLRAEFKKQLADSMATLLYLDDNSLFKNKQGKAAVRQQYVDSLCKVNDDSLTRAFNIFKGRVELNIKTDSLALIVINEKIKNLQDEQDHQGTDIEILQAAALATKKRLDDNDIVLKSLTDWKDKMKLANQ